MKIVWYIVKHYWYLGLGLAIGLFLVPWLIEGHITFLNYLLYLPLIFVCICAREGLDYLVYLSAQRKVKKEVDNYFERIKKAEYN